MIKKYLKKYKKDVKNCLNDFKSIKTWYKQIPNLLTISRPIGIIPANILFFTGNIVPAVILTGMLLLTDLFDGKLARKWNVSSEFGADLDAVCDKLMFLGLAVPLIVNFPSLIWTVLLEAAIAGVNVLGRLKGIDTKTVFAGKVKTVALSLTLGIGYLVQFLNIPTAVFRLFSVVTGISQGVALGSYIYKYQKMMNEKNKDDEQNRVKDNVIFEKLSDKDQDSLLNQLRREREFVLATQQPNKVYTGKRRVRKKIQERNNRY